MKESSCLICTGKVEPFISFGRMPIANAFLTPEQFKKEYFFTLEAGLCRQCSMVQLTQLVDPNQLFHADYAYFSSISTRMAEHFKAWAEAVRTTYLQEPDPFVVEIGSNDGILLGQFAKAGIKHLGVEPSANVAKEAMSKGINTRVCFFNEETGKNIRREFGAADTIQGANVICHIPDLHAVAKGVKALLKPKGVFIFQEPYLGDIVEKASYDQIYDEHVFYFCFLSLESFFAQHGMEIVEMEHHDVHGGSMRYVVALKGSRPVGSSVATWRAYENRLKLKETATYKVLKERIFASRDQLVQLLKDLRKKGKKIAGYGATSKSTTVTNFCGIGPDLVDYISDTTPTKQGKYSPGVHIPVFPYDRFKDSPPDCALLFAWNHAQEIISKEKKFVTQGGRFVTYIPAVKVLDPQ